MNDMLGPDPPPPPSPPQFLLWSHVQISAGFSLLIFSPSENIEEPPECLLDRVLWLLWMDGSVLMEPQLHHDPHQQLVNVVAQAGGSLGELEPVLHR